MEAIKRYKRRMGADPEKATAPFIERALNKVLIQKYASGEATGEELESVLIFKDKEGPDNGILYTYEVDGLKVGDTIIKKGVRSENDVYYLIFEEVKRVDTSVTIRVFNVLEANIIVNGDASKPGYLISNMRKEIRDFSKEQDGFSVEGKRSVLVIPKSYGLKLNDKINLQNLITEAPSYAGWQIEGIDDISSPVIAYYHLTQTPTAAIPQEQPIVNGEVYPQEIIVLETENGYIKTVPSGLVKSRKATEVTIQAPMKGEFIVEVMKEGNLIVKEYVVKEG